MSQKREPNYKALFYLALFFIAFGIVVRNFPYATKFATIVFIAIGGLFLIISLKNKDKWMGK